MASASSAAWRPSGASEHAVEHEWRGALAYSNIGLPGESFTGESWSKKKGHKKKLLDLFTDLLREPVLGLLLCEVGNMSDLLTKKGKARLKDVLLAAFDEAGATEHGPPQYFWSKGDSMAAFRAEVQVRQLKPLTKMKGVDSWRMVERFEVFGASEHSQRSLLAYTRSPWEFWLNDFCFEPCVVLLSLPLNVWADEAPVVAEVGPAMRKESCLF